MQLNSLPNILTLARISLIPVLVVLFYLPFHWSYLAASIVFAVAAITDYLDGYIARKFSMASSLGEFLDPVADKLIVSIALVLLVQTHSTILLTMPAAIIIGREIVVSALREWMAELGKRTNVAVSFLGKVKTTLQMVAITILLSQPHTVSLDGTVVIGYVCLYLASILTLWSMFIYLKAAWGDLISDY
jgi:CDP-diacylglycerol---glycerol-3-phosphate 3-phosphatidyltransferase